MNLASHFVDEPKKSSAFFLTVLRFQAWNQYHTPANLAKSISIEANELLECFQWDDKNFDLQHVKEELADVMVYCQDMLDALGLDEDEIINISKQKIRKKKIAKTWRNYLVLSYNYDNERS